MVPGRNLEAEAVLGGSSEEAAARRIRIEAAEVGFAGTRLRIEGVESHRIRRCMEAVVTDFDTACAYVSMSPVGDQIW